MNSSETYQLISTCDALIERQQFQEALGLLEKTREKTQGVVATWLKGKAEAIRTRNPRKYVNIHMSVAQAISEDYMFQHYATMEDKFKYKNILNDAYNHLYSTVMCLSEASVDIREYLNQYLWTQLGQTENALARTKYWFPDPEQEDSKNHEDTNWSPDPESLIDYVTDMKL